MIDDTSRKIQLLLVLLPSVNFAFRLPKTLKTIQSTFHLKLPQFMEAVLQTKFVHFVKPQIIVELQDV